MWVNCELIFLFIYSDNVFCLSSNVYAYLTSCLVIFQWLSSFSQTTKSPTKLPTVSFSCVLGVIRISSFSLRANVMRLWYFLLFLRRHHPLLALRAAPRFNRQTCQRAMWVNCELIFLFTHYHLSRSRLNLQLSYRLWVFHVTWMSSEFHYLFLLANVMSFEWLVTAIDRWTNCHYLREPFV